MKRSIGYDTKEDDVMSVLIETLLCGWPETKADLPIKLTPYFHTRDEYTVQDGLVFKGDTVVIPVQSAERNERSQTLITHRN